MSALVIAAVLVIAKSTAAALVALAVDAQLRRRGCHRSRGFALLPGLLILLPVLTTLGPSLSSPVVRLPHGIVAMPVSPLFPNVSLATVLVGIWLIGALIFLTAWPTKWPQYILILTAPLSVAAAQQHEEWRGAIEAGLPLLQR